MAQVAAKLIFETAVKRDAETGELKSYWPSRWPLRLLAKEYATSTPSFFNASYMNNALAAAGSQLKRDWLQFYLPDELVAVRKQHGVVGHGSLHVGVDLSNGGDPRTADFAAVACIERIANRGFLTFFHMQRYDLEVQAQKIEEQLDIVGPTFLVIEDTSARGYVFTAFSSQINDGKGSKHPFKIEKPQSKAAGGDKPTRFKAMSARFQNGQIKLPGRALPGGEVTYASVIEKLVGQWTSFPSGHDDGLDALYWAQYSAFGTDVPISASKRADGTVTSHSAYTQSTTTITGGLCEKWEHEAYGKPLALCMSCSLNERLNDRGPAPPTKLSPVGTRAREIQRRRQHSTIAHTRRYGREP